MSDGKAGGAKTCGAIFWAALFALLGLASCGGGGGGDGSDAAATGGAAPEASVPAIVAGDSAAAAAAGGSAAAVIAAPSITSLTATPGSVSYNGTTQIAWSSSDTSSCSLYDTTATSGTISFEAPFSQVQDGATGTANIWTKPNLTANKTYTLRCTNGTGDSIQQTVTVTVAPVPSITLITANPSTVTTGETTTIYWASVNSTSCSLAIPPGTSGSNSNSTTFITGVLTTVGANTYTVTCIDSGNPLSPPSQQSVIVSVVTPPPTPTPLPMVSLIVPAVPVMVNTSINIEWSSTNTEGANPCILTANQPGALGTFGTGPSFTGSTLPLTGNTTFTVTCNGAGGTSASDTKIVSVYNPGTPTAALSAAPASVVSGGTSVIAWTSTDSTSCSITGTGAPSGSLAVSGSFTTPSLTAPATYTATCTGAGGTSSPDTVTVTIDAATCPTVAISGDANAIQLPPVEQIASRLIGVAPLAVFFDAAETRDATDNVVKTGTTATATTARPFHDLEYRWDFGDASAGTWSAGARSGISKNTATGPVAAHVYETPAIYTVKLEVTDGTNTVKYQDSCAPKIEVQNPNDVFPGTNTVCIAASDPPAGVTSAVWWDGCPANATQVVQPNFATAIGTFANPSGGYAKTNKRVLFRRGDTFTATVSGVITQTGPGIVGAFGTDPNKPKVRMEGTTHILVLSTNSSPNITDWRVMDLDFDGLNKSNNFAGISSAGAIHQVLILNMRMRDIYRGVLFSGTTLDWYHKYGPPGHTMWDQLAIVDNTINPNSAAGTDMSSWMIFASARRLAILGNTLGNTASTTPMGSHTVRSSYTGKGVISNNTIARPGATGSGNLGLKLHAPAWCDAGSLAGSLANPAGSCLTFDTTPRASLPNYYSYNPANTNLHPKWSAAETDGYTEHVVVSDNKFIGGGGPYQITVGPQNINNDERVRDVIIERNWFTTASSNTQVPIVVEAREITVRNNICDLTGSLGAQCVDVSPAAHSGTTNLSPEPRPNNIRIYNNTAYRADVANGSSFQFVRIDAAATNVTVKNNLIYATGVTSSWTPHVITFSPSGTTTIPGLIESNNSTLEQMKNTPPGWASATPSVPADFNLTAGSYANAIGAGTIVPVWSDFFRTARPASGVPGDMGAAELP